MKEISSVSRDFQSSTLEQWICNPRITLMHLYLFSLCYLIYKFIYLPILLKPTIDTQRLTDPLRHIKSCSLRIYMSPPLTQILKSTQTAFLHRFSEMIFVPSVSPEGKQGTRMALVLETPKILIYQKYTKYSLILRQDKLQTCPTSISNPPSSNKQAQELQFACQLVIISLFWHLF